MPKKKSQSFESNLNRLEQIVRQLEDGSVPLEQAMELFREGTTLVNCCNQLLDQAEQEIVMLTKGPDGEVTEVPYDANEAE